MRVPSTCLISQLPHGTQLQSLKPPPKCQTCFCKNGIRAFVHTPQAWTAILAVFIGARGGGRAAAALPVPKLSGQTLFSGQAEVAQKILNVKSILNTMRNFRANSVFQDKCKVAQKC